jgi:hypothetical protein
MDYSSHETTRRDLGLFPYPFGLDMACAHSSPWLSRSFWILSPGSPGDSLWLGLLQAARLILVDTVSPKEEMMSFKGVWSSHMPLFVYCV